jgi:hypothetical protein
MRVVWVHMCLLVEQVDSTDGLLPETSLEEDQPVAKERHFGCRTAIESSSRIL